MSHTIQLKPLLLSSNEDMCLGIIMYNGDMQKLSDTVKSVISKKGKRNYQVNIKQSVSKTKVLMSGSAKSQHKALKLSLEEVDVYDSNINKRLKFSTTNN